MKKRIIVLICLLFLGGCLQRTQVNKAITRYNSVAEQLHLGDTKDKVLSILVPTQESLSPDQKKQSEQYIKDGVKVEIYYFRSRTQFDGLTTDDEFTPYVFNNGKLVAIGWATLGGPKTQGQAAPNIYVNQTVY